MTEVTLTNAQHRVLEDTANQPEIPAEKAAEFLPGGARNKVLAALEKGGLLEKRKDGHYITEAGFVALGREPAKAEAKAEKPTAEPKKDKQKHVSKKDVMLTMLKEGVTLKALMEATGWQKHSVHGAMANLKKQQNLNITQSKADGADRVYKIA